MHKLHSIKYVKYEYINVYVNVYKNITDINI